MTTRVNSAEVKQIIATTLDVTPFIIAASNVVTGVLAGSGYSATELKEIERWYTAHLVSARDISKGKLRRKKIGDAEEEYAMDYRASGLDSSTYGQTVKELDYKGLMANLGKRQAKFQTMQTPSED